MRNDREVKEVPLKSNIAEYMREIANSQSKGLIHSKYGNLWVKKDPQGYIINPENMDLKIGWGPCEKTAFINFLERNGHAKLV